MVSNNFMEIRMDGGGGSLNLEILRGGGLKQFLKFKWKGGGVKKPCLLSGRGVWIFSRILTHCHLICKIIA